MNVSKVSLLQEYFGNMVTNDDEYELSHDEHEINYESNEPYQVLLIIDHSFGISKRWIATT